jgi:hypothetical protein
MAVTLKTSRVSTAGDLARALALGVVVFLLFNANGREIGGYDSQPAKFAARELALHGTVTLDRVVAATPAYAERPGFQKAVDGHIRSAYSVVPAIIAGGVGTAMAAAGMLDLEATLAPTIMAKVTASLLAAIAVMFAYGVARRWSSPKGALVVAAAYGLGTNVWAAASQSLGGHETVAVALAGAVFCLAAPAASLGNLRAFVGAALLAIAGATRPQLAPAIAVMLLWTTVGGARANRLIPVLTVAAGAAVAIAFNVLWFGHVLGATPRLEVLHPSVHAIAGSFSREPWVGTMGLLASPSRGVLVFSPILLFALAGVPTMMRGGWRGPLAWTVGAAAVQFSFYSAYTVWWGGHTYGPRYLIDVLPLVVPIGAAAAAAIVHPLARALCWIALAFSVALAATGAFSYPAERWNTDPTDVDRDHARLWDWRDPQFVRCWRQGLSPQNFDLFAPGVFHAAPTEASPRD